MLFVPVAGTHGTEAEDPARVWWYRDHPFLSFMRANDIEPVDAEDPFYWSTDLSRRAWIAGGLALIWYCTAKIERLRSSPLVILSHSFGLSAVAYAAYYGLEIDTLISVGPPYRATLNLQYGALRFRTKRWLTIHAAEPDSMVVGGGLFDGEYTPYPPKFDADYRDTMPGIDHSRILYDENFFHLWRDNGWLELAKSQTWGNRRSARRAFDTTDRLKNSYRRSADRFNARSIR